MRFRCLIAPDIQKVRTSIESFEPYFKAKDKGENSADDDGITVNFEELPVRGCGNRRDAEEEGNEDQRGVDDRS